MRVAVLQMVSGEDKKANLEKAAQMLKEAAERRVNLAVLPELFNFLPRRMETARCLTNAEGEDGETIRMLRELSREEGIAIVAGSIIEREGEMLYNTSFAVADGKVVGKYRKNHLFNYGKIKEGEVFTPGGSPAVLDLLGTKVGITICYDLRFPELFRAEALLGAEIIANVATFLKETGKSHWMPLLRARAIENLAFIIAANQGSTEENRFRYYGNSCIINPWGKVVRRAGFGEEIIIGDLRREIVKASREKIPIFKDYKAYDSF